MHPMVMMVQKIGLVRIHMADAPDQRSIVDGPEHGAEAPKFRLFIVDFAKRHIQRHSRNAGKQRRKRKTQDMISHNSYPQSSNPPTLGFFRLLSMSEKSKQQSGGLIGALDSISLDQWHNSKRTNEQTDSTVM
jgi:hypothetical protein